MLRLLWNNFPFIFSKLKLSHFLCIITKDCTHLIIYFLIKHRKFIYRIHYGLGILYYQWKLYYHFMCIYASIMRNDISTVSKNHHTIKSGSYMLGKIVDNILYALFLQHLKNCKKIHPTLICCDNDHAHLYMAINSIV